MANKQTLFCGTNKQYLDSRLTREANKSNGGVAFRIPSLVNANGTLVAAIDHGYTALDWGHICLAVRTSKDGGKTWSDIKNIATPPAREISSDPNNTATAFYIDPCMAVAQNGDVVLLVTFYPESKGLHNKNMLDKNKLAYATFDGKTCPLIYDRDDKYYYVLEDSKVIDSTKAPTEYKVNFVDGELYKGEEYVGSIFLNGAKGKAMLLTEETTYGAPLKAVRRSYVFMLRSSDQGETWSKPVDITGDILNHDKDGAFLGIAPGNAPTLQNGRLVFPLYTLNGTVCIYSDDNGKTWRRNKKISFTPNIDEWTLVEAPDGTLHSFSRSKFYGQVPRAVSRDHGITWEKHAKAPFKAPKCQKNAISIGDKVYVSHPSAKKRENGVINVGKFEMDKKNICKGIKWKKTSIKINEGFFAYSAMAAIDENTIGILYEDQPGSHIVFETINV